MDAYGTDFKKTIGTLFGFAVIIKENMPKLERDIKDMNNLEAKIQEKMPPVPAPIEFITLGESIQRLKERHEQHLKDTRRNTR